jgi:hypothetical protein
MKLLINVKTYGYLMTGIMGANARWFLGFSKVLDEPKSKVEETTEAPTNVRSDTLSESVCDECVSPHHSDQNTLSASIDMRRYQRIRNTIKGEVDQ